MTTLREQFLHPPSEFTPIPFWFWNDKLTHEEIKRQIHQFYEKGIEGFVIHPRLGLPKSIRYLSDEFMSYVRTAVAEASCLSMSVMLYDEAMYPSGSAHGRVVQDDPMFASRGLEMIEIQPGETLRLGPNERLVSLQFIDVVNEDLAVQNLSLKAFKTDPPSKVVYAFVDKPSNGTIRGVHVGEDDGEPEAPASADLLNPLAVQSFIHHTHDVYKQSVGKWMGTTITAFFTDEPDILGRNVPESFRPWTENFLEDFIRLGGKEEELGALWFNCHASEKVRSRFNQAVNERLSTVYYKQLASWCEENGLALTGHPAASTDIGLLKHFHIPGQDVVWRWVAPEDHKALEGPHSTAAKCGADAARHAGKRRNLNEFLGVCSKDGDWTLTADDMKWYIDWLAVRGVNLFCPHAFYYSVTGKERSHERPPDVGMHNSWWPYYNQFSTYMKRLSWLMTDSVNQANVAVLCTENDLPSTSIKSLYEHQVEFNYLEENLLDQALIEEGTLVIGYQRYQTVLALEEVNLKEETKEWLRSFQEHGGRVLSNVDPHLECTLKLTPHSDKIRVTHVKKAGQSFYLLVNEGEERFEGTCRVPTNSLQAWNPWTGTIAHVRQRTHHTFECELGRRESMILVPTKDTAAKKRIDTDHSRVCIDIPSEGWEITCNEEQIDETKLTSWTTWGKEWSYFSGTVQYRIKVELTEEQCVRLNKLDAGALFEIAELWINDIHIGNKLWSPYQFFIPDGVLKEGQNQIALIVTNSKANEMDQVARASGLIGPLLLSD
ncbi:glycosyl hydrolase [Alkalicoccobacillus gibsonii]|uniref:Glycosyl hydrolase n=1 Tax=Alkalicoccobacillus gibsonii TaxID=79881 RepID=A0ABU9VDQ7_9BACI